MKTKYKIFTAFIAIVILFVGIIPANFNETYAADKEGDKAGLLERALSGFFLIGALGAYALTAIVAGAPISIETLIFNQYGNTRLSFFDGNKDGSNKTINPYIADNKIIDSINSFTNMLTELAVIAYMLILVYMGIRILLGTTAERGSKYKELFTYWVQGIAVLFFFPFVIKGTIMINDAFVQYVYTLKDSITTVGGVVTNNGSLTPELEASNGNANMSKMEDEIQNANANLKSKQDYMSVMFKLALEEGWLVYAICWTVMVKQLITLLIIYFKRMLTVAFLIAVYPLVTISYAIDKIGDGKSQAFSNWYKEFALNVFVQSFHAIVYVIGMALIISLGQGENRINECWLLVLFIITFISKGDDMLRNIFHMKGGGGDTVKGIAGTMLQVKGASELAKKTRGALNNKFGAESRLGQLSSRIDATRQSSLNNRLRTETMNERLLDEQEEAAGATLDLSEEQVADVSAPLTASERMLTSADIVFNAGATDEEKKQALEEMIAAASEEGNEEALKDLEEYVRGTYGEEAAKQMMGIMAARNIKVNLNEKIELLLEGMRSGKVRSAYAGRVRSKEEMEKLREISSIKFKKPAPGKFTKKAARRGARAGGAVGAREYSRTRREGDRYSGEFVCAASENMKRAKERFTPKTFKQKVVGAGAKVVAAGTRVSSKASSIRSEGVGKYAKRKVKQAGHMVGGKFVDASQRAKLKAAEIRVKTKSTVNKYVASKDENGKLVAGTHFIEKSNAKASKQKELYMRQARQFRKMGRTEDAEKIENFVNNPGQKHLTKIFGVRMGGTGRSIRIAHAQVKLNMQGVKTARQAIWERKRGNTAKAEQLEQAVATHQVTRIGKPTDPNLIKRPSIAQRVLDVGTQIDSIRELRRVKKTGSRAQVEAAERAMQARNLAVRNTLRANNVLLKSPSLIERSVNSKILRKANAEARIDRIKLVEADFKSAAQIISDRKNGGRNTTYDAAGRKIDEANEIRTRLRKQGIYLQSPRISSAVAGAVGAIDKQLDKRQNIRDARQGMAEANDNAYSQLRRAREMKKSGDPDAMREAIRLEAEAVSSVRRARSVLKKSGAVLVGPTIAINHAEADVRKEVQKAKREAGRAEAKADRLERSVERAETPLRKLVNAKKGKADAPTAEEAAKVSKLSAAFQKAQEQRGIATQDRDVLMGIARDSHISVTAESAGDKIKSRLSSAASTAAATPGRVADTARDISGAVITGATAVYTETPKVISQARQTIAEMPDKLKSQWDGIMHDIREEAAGIVAKSSTPTREEPATRIVGRYKPTSTSTTSDRTEESTGESKESREKEATPKDTSVRRAEELTELNASIDAINTSATSMYTVTELLTHINKIKQLERAYMPGSEEYAAVHEALGRLAYDVDDYESNLRIQVLNDTTLVADDDPNRRKIIDSSISYVQQLPGDDIMLSTLKYDPGELTQGHDPMRRLGTKYGTTGRMDRSEEEENALKSAFAASLREKEMSDLQREIDAGSAEIRRNALGIASSAVGAVADVAVGVPLSVGVGLVSAGMGASATKSGSLVTMNAATSGMVGYSLANKEYDKASGLVGKGTKKLSKEAETIREKLTRGTKDTSSVSESGLQDRIKGKK